jgi:hypothetical protein
MWRLIKSELEYLKPAIIAVYVLVIFNILLRSYLVYLVNLGEKITAIRLDSILYVQSYISLFYLMLTFILLILEVKESRIGQFATLPVSVRNLGLSRILLPLALMAIFMLLSIIENAAEPYPFRPIYYEGQSLLYSLLFAGWVSFIPFWLMATYGIWLLSENGGRILLGIFFVFLVAYDGIFPAVNPQLSWGVQDFVKDWTVHNVLYNNWVAVVVMGIFAGIIFLSFMKRRSYV